MPCRPFAAVLSLPLLVSCAVKPHAVPAFAQVTALACETKLGGCVVADLDTRARGNEIAAVAGDGQVHVVYCDQGTFRGTRALHCAGEMIQCAAGDLDPAHPGDELVLVGAAEGGEDDGGPGVAYYAWCEDGTFRMETLLEDEALIHAVCIGDVDPGRPGLEVVLAGYTQQVFVLSRGVSGWTVERAGTLPGQGKGAAVGMGGAVIACADGSLVRFRKVDGRWNQHLLVRGSHALARVAAGLDAAVVCDNGGNLTLVNGSEIESCHVDGDRLRGAVFSHLLPGSRGIEIGTAGYNGKIYLVQHDATRPGWTITEVGSDSGKLHHVAAGELDGLGPCLVGCGYSGHLIVVHRAD